jgi:signal transduction histidine kinase
VRHGLLQSTLAAVLVSIMLLGLPLALAFQLLAEQRVQDELQRQVDDVASAIEELPDGFADPQLLAFLRGFVNDSDRRLTVYVRGPNGAVGPFLEVGGGPEARFDEDLVAAVRAGAAARVYEDGRFAVTVPGQRDGAEFWVRMVEDDGGLHQLVGRARAGIVTLALVSLAGAGMAAIWQGRRFAVPLEQLASSARRLGDGDFSARAPRSGLPEPDEVAAALDSTADRLAVMLERSRSFNADASHQLRTPLTALRLDLEALEAAGADPQLVGAAVKEADRLEATISELLALAEAPQGDETIDLAELAAQRLDAWRALARAQGREVVLDAQRVPRVRARAAALGQSLQVLLDNALEHGSGTITVSVSQVAGGVRLSVGDEGPGIPEEREASLFRPTGPLRTVAAGGLWGRRAPTATLERSSSGRFRRPPPVPPGERGRGLPLARSLVEAEGGRLRLEQARPGAVLSVLLPAARNGKRPPAPSEPVPPSP